MKHYFIENPDLPVNERELHLHFNNLNFYFTTTTGLFSHEEIDGASLLLLDVICKTQPPLSGALLDLGCGYGLIGTVLAKTHAGSANIVMSDINNIACRYAEKNAIKNGVKANVIHSDGFTNIQGLFHHIILNPPIHAGKETMYRLYAESAAHLTPDGALYVVIQKKHGAESTLVVLGKSFSDIQILYKRKGFFIIRCAQRT